MAIDLEEYNRLKKKADSLKSQADRATGALEQCMEKLKEEFDCDSIEEARSLMKDMEKKQDSIEIAYNKALQEFEEKWNSQL